MTDRLLIISMLFLLTFNPSSLEAADWRLIVDLKGTWHFTVGDDKNWASLNADISDWDRLPVPAGWEQYYQGYNGFAWYRKPFIFNNSTTIKTFTLFLGYIDDVDEVFINGQKVGQSGRFPPNFQTAYNRERRYQVPAEIVKPGENVICVRVFDEAKNGGIVRGERIGIYYDENRSLLDIDLSGTWKFSPDYWKGFKNTKFDDREWDDIFVPMNWESQGYEDLDGTAWYRKRFRIPDQMMDKELYLILGKIDDFEKVYLNGRLIGEVEELPGYSRLRRNNSYQLFRAYRIPPDLLQHQNVIAVEVEDRYGEGGIYEGPVGIIEGQNKAEELLRKYRWRNRNRGWESFFNDLFDLLD